MNGAGAVPYPYPIHAASPVRSWRALLEAESSFDGSDEWAFRGQDTREPPASSLERHCKDLGVAGAQVLDLEVKLVRDFARRYHLYAGHAPPRTGNTLEWLALLRHYGTPTRLLDFSYSFFVATFFALECAREFAGVWAVNATKLSQAVDQHLPTSIAGGQDLLQRYRQERDGEAFRALFMHSPPISFAGDANPIRLNERLTIQQGLFLAPGDVTSTFEDNLRTLPRHEEFTAMLVIDTGCRSEILRKLHRMAINSATLFPGLEGFARSLRTKSLILRDLPAQSAKMLEDV